MNYKDIKNIDWSDLVNKIVKCDNSFYLSVKLIKYFPDNTLRAFVDTWFRKYYGMETKQLIVKVINN